METTAFHWRTGWGGRRLAPGRASPGALCLPSQSAGTSTGQAHAGASVRVPAVEHGHVGPQEHVAEDPEGPRRQRHVQGQEAGQAEADASPGDLQARTGLGGPCLSPAPGNPFPGSTLSTPLSDVITWMTYSWAVRLNQTPPRRKETGGSFGIWEHWIKY